MERISSLFRQVSDSRTAKPEKFHLESAEASVHPTSIRIVESIHADDIFFRVGTHVGYCLFINCVFQIAKFNISQYYINNTMAHIHLGEGSFPLWALILWTTLGVALVSAVVYRVRKGGIKTHQIALAGIGAAASFAIFQLNIPIWGG
ncbi:MAG: hypothetical protein J07HQX50_01573, partial [Haloquadratum sp. J07HQX50]